MKRVIMTHKADGTEEYVCRCCGQKLRHCDDYHMSFSGGEIDEQGGEYLFCDTCGVRAEYPRIPEPQYKLDAQEEKMNGMKVTITGLDGNITIYRNVTNVHFGYPSPFGCNYIAFESDIHTTGATNNIGNITEMLIEPEVEIAELF